MDPVDSNIISSMSVEANTILAHYGELVVLGTQWAAHAADVTDAIIAEVPSFAMAGLTKAKLDATMYILNSILALVRDTDLDAYVTVARLG